MSIFCKPISSKKRFLPFRKLNEIYSFSIFEKASSIPASDWECVLQNKTLFLDIPFLTLLEQCSHVKLNFRYILVFNKTKPCGIIYIQIAKFNLDLFSNQIDTLKFNKLNIFKKIVGSNKKDGHLMLITCGNNILSGDYGFLFDEKINQKISSELLLKIMDVISKEEKLTGTISATLIKDFVKPLEPKKLFESKNYFEFLVEPRLIIQIQSNIKTLDDYVDSFSKKYRKRAKAVLNLFLDLESRILNTEEVKKHEIELYDLYSQVFDRAKFKLLKLPQNYFSDLKATYPETFFVKAFFYNKQLVAFVSSFLMPMASIEAHYIGFNYELNTKLDLYQNILYSLINDAIINKCTSVNLGRSAAEIKSTVGAIPENLYCYIKPQNTISKLFLNPFIDLLRPSPWIPRNPFK